MIKYGIDIDAVEELVKLGIAKSKEEARKIVSKDLPKAEGLIKEAHARRNNVDDKQ